MQNYKTLQTYTQKKHAVQANDIPPREGPLVTLNGVVLQSEPDSLTVVFRLSAPGPTVGPRGPEEAPVAHSGPP